MLPTSAINKFGMAVTYRCNMHDACSYCYAKCLAAEYAEMDPEHAARCLSWLTSLRPEWLVKILGGEPSQHTQFADLLNLCDRARIDGTVDLRVYTNGTVDDAGVEAMLGTHRLGGVVIHYDEKYAEAVPNLLQHVRAICGALVDDGKQVDFRFNTSDPTFPLGVIWELAQEYGGSIIYSFTAPSRGVSGVVELDMYREFVPALAEAVEHAEKCGVRLQSSRPFPQCVLPMQGRSEFMTRAGIATTCQPYPTMNPDGSLLVCSPVFKWSSDPVTDEPGFRDAFNAARTAAGELQWNTPRWQECEHCAIWLSKECQGGCLAYCNSDGRKGEQ